MRSVIPGREELDEPETDGALDDVTVPGSDCFSLRDVPVLGGSRGSLLPASFKEESVGG